MTILRIVLIALAQWIATVAIYYLAAGREMRAFQSPFVVFLPTVVAFGVEYMILFSSNLWPTQRAGTRVAIAALCALLSTAMAFWAALVVGADKWGV